MKPGRVGLRLLAESSFSGPGVYLTTLVYTLALHFTDTTVRTEVPVLFRILFVLIIHTSVYSFIKFGRTWLFPTDSGGWQLGKTILVLLFAGLARGYVMHYLAEGIELYRTDDLLFRVTISLQNIPVAFAFAGIGAQAYEEWRSRRQKLASDNARLAELLTSTSEKAKAEHQRMIDSVTGQLLRFVREIEKSKPTDVIENLRNGITRIVRPLTVEVHDQPVIQPLPTSHNVNFSIRQLLSSIVYVRPLEPIFMPLAVVWIGLPYVINNFGFATMPTFIALTVLVAVVVYGVFTFLLERAKASATLTWGLMLASAIFTAIAETQAISFVIHTSDRTPKLFEVLFFFNILLVLMFGATASVIHMLTEVETELLSTQRQLSWAVARETEVQRQQSHNLAVALHGPVQSTVGASIIRLENAALKGQISQDLIAEVSLLIYESLEQLQESGPQVNFGQVCEDLATTWAGICEFELDWTPQAIARLQKDPITSKLAGEIVPELCFNSIKHGSATKIAIRFAAPATRTFTVLIDDNGTEFQEGPSRGLGLRHLYDSALQVKRSYNDGVNRVSIILPFDPSPPPPELASVNS